MKILDRRHIGKTFKAKAPNGTVHSVTIEDNPKKFKLYEILGLDVFKTIASKPLKPKDNPEDMSWPELKKWAKENGIEGKTKKEILDGYTANEK